MRYVTLIVTQDCNLNCSYCYEHNKTQHSMSVDLAKQIITDELNAVDDFDEISFEFFGGEPFLEFEKIKEIVSYFRSQTLKKPFHFFAGTNGTLFNDSMKTWLIENQDIFQIALSLDGTKEMHDLNRSCSFDLIDIDFFTKEFKNIIVKSTISPGTLGSLCDGVIFLHKIGFKNIACNLAVGIDWANRNNIFLLQRELNKLIEFYLKHSDLQVCSLLDYSIENIVHPINGKVLKYCGAGTRTRVYDIDGQEYPCQYFLPMTIGERSRNAGKVEFSDIMDINDLDECCQKCVAISICPSCYGSNYKDYNNIHKRDYWFCNLQKIIILANSYFKAKKWEKHQLDLDEYTEQELLHSILKIQESMKIDGFIN